MQYQYKQIIANQINLVTKKEINSSNSPNLPQRSASTVFSNPRLSDGPPELTGVTCSRTLTVQWRSWRDRYEYNVKRTDKNNMWANCILLGQHFFSSFFIFYLFQKPLRSEKKGDGYATIDYSSVQKRQKTRVQRKEKQDKDFFFFFFFFFYIFYFLQFY